MAENNNNDGKNNNNNNNNDKRQQEEEEEEEENNNNNDNPWCLLTERSVDDGVDRLLREERLRSTQAKFVL